MKKAINLFLFSLIINALVAEGQGIHFEQGLTLEQIMQKAKAEGKYVFVDCFTTWCGPCKRMDKETYTIPKVINFVDSHFVAVKVQLDTTQSDDENTRRLYQSSAAIGHKYKIRAYPSYLFFSPDGELIHRGVGFMNEHGFLYLTGAAVDTNKQFYTLLKKFNAGSLSYKQMPSLATDLRAVGELTMANEISRSYIDKFLLKLNAEALFKKNNILYIASNIQSSKDSSFTWVYRNSNEIDNIMGDGFSRSVVSRQVTREEITPILVKWDSLNYKNVSTKAWRFLERRIAKKYDEDLADRIVLDGQLRWYTKSKEWKESVILNVKKIKKYGLDTASDDGILNLNNMIYEVIFKHSHDKRVIDKALDWMKIICRIRAKEPDYMDTYANLLYKSGEVKEAISIEERAFLMEAVDKDTRTIVDNMTKMKQGKPTWPSD